MKKNLQALDLLLDAMMVAAAVYNQSIYIKVNSGFEIIITDMNAIIDNIQEDDAPTAAADNDKRKRKSPPQSSMAIFRKFSLAAILPRC